MAKQKPHIPIQSLLGTHDFIIKPLVSFIDREALDEKPHRHKWQEIIYLKSGEGSHKIDDQTIILKPKTFYLIGKGQVHDFLAGKNLDGFLIRFVDNFLPPMGLNTQNSLNSTLLGSIISTNELHIPDPEIFHYETILNEIIYEYEKNEQTYAKIEIIQYLLLALLTKLERRVRHVSRDTITNAESKEMKTYHGLLLLIEENYRKHHEISFYVKELGIDSRKLTRVTKKAIGKSPKQILNDRLLVEAKRLLLFTKKSSKEIAYHLGYEDPAYFSRFFKLNTKLSPRKYKIEKSPAD